MAVTDAVVSRRAWLRAAAAVSLAGLAGCSDGSAPVGSNEADAPEDDISGEIALGIGKPEGIEPFDALDAAGAQICFQLFDPLMRYDYEYGVLTCLVAERYAVSEDQREFTFILRDTSFHNGDPVCSSDFKRAWERLVSPSSAASRLHGGPSDAAYLLSLVEGYQDVREGRATSLSGVSCPDDRTLKVRLSVPYVDFPFVLTSRSLAPVPAAAEQDAEAFAALPVGNGPYRLARALEEGAGGIELTRFEDYAWSVTTIDTVRFKFYDRVADAYRRFEAGDLAVSPCPVESVDVNVATWKSTDDERLQINDDRRTVLGSELTVSYLACNTAEAPLNDAAVRRALSLAIDRDGLAKQVFRNARPAADGIVPPDVPGYREQAWDAAAYDTEAANDLLDERYPRGTDGMRDLKVTLQYSPDSGHGDAMELIAEQLEAIGVACELEEAGLKDLVERMRSGAFQLARFDWTLDFPSMDNVLYPLFHSASIGAFNFSRYANEQVDARIGDARAAQGQAERTRLLQEADDLIAADVPVIPYAFGAHAVVGTQRVAKLVIDPEGFAHLGGAELAE